MDFYVPWYSFCVLLCSLLPLLDQVLGSSVDNEANSDIRCLCEIFNENSEVMYKYDVIETYPKWPTSDCHYLHKKCRVKCGLQLDLDGYIDTGDTRMKRGVAYCHQYGRPTQHAPLMLRMRWQTRGCPHHSRISSKKTQGLCCGYTSILGQQGRSGRRVLGWNPDCRAQNYYIARTHGG